MQHDFSAALSAAEQEFNIGKGEGKFKLQEGANKIRILSEHAVLQNEYKGERNIKFLTRVFDYATGRVKLAFFPYTIAKAIAALQKSDDYAFTEIPMPYDITINAKNAGTKDVEYQVVPARNNSEVPAEALAQLAKEKPITEVRDMIAELQSHSNTSTNSEELPV